MYCNDLCYNLLYYTMLHYNIGPCLGSLPPCVRVLAPAQASRIAPIYIYIYIEREREREKYVFIYVCIYIYISIYTHL